MKNDKETLKNKDLNKSSKNKIFLDINKNEKNNIIINENLNNFGNKNLTIQSNKEPDHQQKKK